MHIDKLGTHRLAQGWRPRTCYALALGDLASPPGNRLEALRDDLVGVHSIRINDQWRIVCRWRKAGPVDVDIRDYH